VSTFQGLNAINLGKEKAPLERCPHSGLFYYTYGSLLLVVVSNICKLLSSCLVNLIGKTLIPTSVDTILLQHSMEKIIPHTHNIVISQTYRVVGV
jgi:hypothetical protein